MKVAREISPKLFPKQSPKLLKAFFSRCQKRAIKYQHPQLVSMSLKSKYLDPLAILQSIYELEDWHFYMEHPEEDLAIAGIEGILEETFSGPQRFQAMKAYVQKILKHSIVIRDKALPFSGPHFFSAFAFYDEAENDKPHFAPATLFVPRWQVAQYRSTYISTANVSITPDTDLDKLTERIWRAHQTFKDFDYAKPQLPQALSLAKDLQADETGGPEHYKKIVATAVQNIKDEKYEKIVLARALDYEATEPLHPLRSLDRLRKHFPSCSIFSFANNTGESFIGATPETLLRVKNKVLETEALAGTAPRGKSAETDVQIASGLLQSNKNLHEQNLVFTSIIDSLKALKINIKANNQPRLKKLKNVYHLMTPITGKISAKTHLLDILEKLHPTPAVGGLPKAKSIPDIQKLEPFARELYAGTLGYFDTQGNGHMVVGIRSALLSNKNRKARLYAGAGIVKDSIPEAEAEETELKLEALREVL